jgi:hypothetical protein
VCAETYFDWVSRLREDSLRRRKSVRLTNASASSSSGWPTPVARNALDNTRAGITTGNSHAGPSLPDVAKLWPTPQARDGKGANQEELIDWGNARPLNEVAVLWPTPTSSRGGPDLERRDTGKPNSDLVTATAAWRTPTSADAGRGVSLTWNIGEQAGEHSLRQQSALWQSPTVGDTTGGHSGRSGDRKTEPLLNGQAREISSHLDPMTYSVGDVSSPDRRSLNPLFVEWLMGWPAGWTLLGWIDFACSATELSLWSRDMRSALSLIASHDAPPVQLDLFGG